MISSLDPFLWQKILQLAIEREREGVGIVSSELTARCGIPPDQTVAYLEAMAEARGWVSPEPDDRVLIPVD